MSMKQKIKDLEIQNALLSSQVKVLKTQAIKTLGTAKDVHKEMFRNKLEQIYNKRKIEAEQALDFVAKIAKRPAGNEEPISALKAQEQSLVEQTISSQIFSHEIVKHLDSLDDKKTEELLKMKKQEIMKRRRQTYEESILIKNLQMSHSSYMKEDKIEGKGMSDVPEEDKLM